MKLKRQLHVRRIYYGSQRHSVKLTTYTTLHRVGAKTIEEDTATRMLKGIREIPKSIPLRSSSHKKGQRKKKKDYHFVERKVPSIIIRGNTSLVYKQKGVAVKLLQTF